MHWTDVTAPKREEAEEAAAYSGIVWCYWLAQVKHNSAEDWLLRAVWNLFIEPLIMEDDP